MIACLLHQGLSHHGEWLMLAVVSYNVQRQLIPVTMVNVKVTLVNQPLGSSLIRLFDKIPTMNEGIFQHSEHKSDIFSSRYSLGFFLLANRTTLRGQQFSLTFRDTYEIDRMVEASSWSTPLFFYLSFTVTAFISSVRPRTNAAGIYPCCFGW